MATPCKRSIGLSLALGACWLLAFGVCSSLALILAASGGDARVPLQSQPAAGGSEALQVRGRVVPADRWEIPSEASLIPPRTAAGLPLERKPCKVAAPGAEGLAALTGRILCDGQGVSGQLRFELGWNQGRVLDASGDGRFTGRDLGPGYQLVTVTVEGRPPCTRSLFLPPYRETAQNLDFGSPYLFRVLVRDAEGDPVSGADVQLDGAPATTDAAGRATLTSACSGASELVVRAPGHAWFSCACERSPAEVEVCLDPACVLELSLPATADASGAIVYLMPRGAERLAGHPVRPATPWHVVSPLHIAAGGTVRLENLPAGELEVRVLEPGAPAGVERLVLGPLHPVSRTLRSRKPASGVAADVDSLRTLLSSAGLGSLPRSQPLAPLR